MGCYGIGSSRLIGAIVETSHDPNGMIWPQSVAPYEVHLVSLARNSDEQAKADEIYVRLQDSGIEVLYDDRDKVSPGAKFADSDLIGIPFRIIAGSRSLKENKVELKNRKTGETQLIPLETMIASYRQVAVG
jgi:prolyl-tRNA synthetase